MAYRVWLFVWLCFGFSASLANATNIQFLPGDAFFYTRLTKETCDGLLKDERFSLSYLTSELSPGSFCGYAGYGHLRFPDGTQSLVENLTQVYTQVRKHHWRELTEHQDDNGQVRQLETNGLPMFIYNESFDPLRHFIGLKYNESWVEDELGFGVRKNFVKLDVFDPSPLMFGHEWRDSREIPPLQVKCPAIPDLEKRKKYGLGGDLLMEPVFCEGPVQIILIDAPNLTTYFESRNDFEFYVIKSSGVTKHYFDEDGGKTAEPWRPEPESKDDSKTSP